MLDALGVRFLDAVGARVRPSGATLSAIVTADWADAVDLSGIEVIGASDVTNPLFGEEGAAAVFAPQKGATPEEVALLEAGLRQ
ncbi:glycerate kinase, partial [Rhizobium johnstonii]